MLFSIRPKLINKMMQTIIIYDKKTIKSYLPLYIIFIKMPKLIHN